MLPGDPHDGNDKATRQGRVHASFDKYGCPVSLDESWASAIGLTTDLARVGPWWVFVHPCDVPLIRRIGAGEAVEMRIGLVDGWVRVRISGTISPDAQVLEMEPLEEAPRRPRVTAWLTGDVHA